MNSHFTEIPTQDELDELRYIINKGTLSPREKYEVWEDINNCTDYNEYNRILWKIEESRKNIDWMQNPLQGDINKHIKRFTG